MMGVDDTRNVKSDIAIKYRLYIFAFRWIFINIDVMLVLPHLVKNFPAFHGNRRFITMFTRSHYLSLS